MAQIETITIVNFIGRRSEEDQELGFNVSAIVGKGGANNPDDVMVVQAMLKYIATTVSLFNADLLNVSVLRNMLDPKLEPNGEFDKATEKGIRIYQEINSRS